MYLLESKETITALNIDACDDCKNAFLRSLFTDLVKTALLIFYFTFYILRRNRSFR